VPSECDQAYHMFYLLLPSLNARQRLIEQLRSNGILAVFHYLPLHLSEVGRKFGGKVGDCPVTETVSDRLLRLPFYNDLDEGDQLRVIDVVRNFEC
jgi:dTDP-4-amino-4,6-dideoxygalactose transaminase